MDLTKMFVSQRKLRTPTQVYALVLSVCAGAPIPPILLSEDEDETIQVEDGHHRACAYWIAGRRQLEVDEYIVKPRDRWRPRFGRIVDLITRVRIELPDEL